MQAFPDKAPGEAKILTFDFTNEVADGATLSGPTIAKSLIAGSDTGAATLTVGAASVSGALVSALVSAGTDGNTYKLLATVSASNGETHQLAASMIVSDRAA